MLISVVYKHSSVLKNRCWFLKKLSLKIGLWRFFWARSWPFTCLSKFAKSTLRKNISLSISIQDEEKTQNFIKPATSLESGKRVACYIGGADSECISPPKVEEYISSVFSGSSFKGEVCKEREQFRNENPLFEAVNRAASSIERHQGRIVFLEYTPSGLSKHLITYTYFFLWKLCLR